MIPKSHSRKEYRAYVELMRKLTLAVQKGRGGGKYAEHIRDALDTAWLKLTKEEQESFK